MYIVYICIFMYMTISENRKKSKHIIKIVWQVCLLVCVCVCVYSCIHTCEYIWKISVEIVEENCRTSRAFLFVYVCMCVCVCVSIHMNIHGKCQVKLWKRIEGYQEHFVLVYVCVCVCVCLCMSVHLNTYKNIR